MMETIQNKQDKLNNEETAREMFGILLENVKLLSQWNTRFHVDEPEQARKNLETMTTAFKVVIDALYN